MRCASLTVTPDILYKWCSYIRSYHFIANSASYLNAADLFLDGFSVPVISQIESIGGGQAGRGGGGYGNHSDSNRSAVQVICGMG